ncbi:MAG: 3-oxoacyl-[acyl-carrier-protein] reductase FabG [Verrucomicrobiae bacterium]|nr:3-oxoacyl-[acyl-carrier-protein] reductase FabG [Verrucomicrobiae bacterium]
MQLRGKTVLVTGAGKRVGREIALGLARRGANIVVHYHTSARPARQLVAEIKALGVNAVAVRADQTNARQVRAAVATAGQIDVLVASAAVYERTPFAKLTEADWDFHLDANLKGPFLWSLEVGKRMKTGKMIFFADWAAVRPYRHYLPYLVSKAGIICLTKALAKELAPRVQVNAIAPGPVLLPADFTKKETRQVIESTVVKRLGSPQDIVNSVIFLIEGSDFITGHTLMVDGGRLIAGA